MVSSPNLIDVSGYEMTDRSQKLAIFAALLLACITLTSCSDNPTEDIKTTLNIFMPDTSSMNVSRFRKETAPSPNVGFASSESVRPQKLPMRPQSTRLATAAPVNAVNGLDGYPPPQ